MKQYAALDDTVYFWFAANDTSGSGGDGATPAADVRLAGAAADAAPVYSPTPVLLSHANYPAGAYEIAIAATAANGFVANNVYAVFCTLAIDAQNPTGFVGSFDLKPVEANVTQLLDTAWLTPGVAGTPDVNAKLLGGTAQTGNDVGADVNDILTDTGTTLDTLIKDIPTVAEFEARSILAANYVLTSDTIAGVTAVTNDVGITQAGADKVWGTAARALTDKAEFTLSTAGITAIWNKDISAYAGAGYAGTYIKVLYDDWLNGGRLDLIIDAILADTGEIGVAGAGLTDLGGMATGMKTEVESEVNDALVALKLDHLIAVADNDDPVNDSIIAKLASSAATADWSTFVNTTDALQAIRDRGDVAWTTGAGGSDRLLMVDTTIATLASQTSFTLTAGSADDDAYNNATIVIEDASTATQKAIGLISNYAGATKTITLKYDPGIFTIATTDKVYILAENALKATLANRQLNIAADGDIAGDVDGSVASVVADVGITQAGADKVRASVCVTGDPANSIGKILYEIYTNRLTSARAGYLANINNANLATIADISTLTATEIAYLNASISSRSSHAASAIWSVGTRALTDKAGFALSTAGILAIWHQLTANIVTANTIGKLLKDDINATISSRSSHDAAAVWSAGSRELSTPANYKANVSSLALEATLTAMKGATFAEATDSLEAIRNQGDAAWITAVGFSTHNAAAVWSAGSRALSTPADYKADVSALALEATLTAMKGATFLTGTDSLEAIRNRGDAAWITGGGGSAADIADAVWDELQSGHTGVGSFGKYLDMEVSGVGGIGSGALSCTWTQKDEGGTAMDNVQVWISTDEAGNNVIAGTLLTNASGEVTFMLDAGTYYVWREKAGYNFTNPQTWVVS